MKRIKQTKRKTQKNGIFVLLLTLMFISLPRLVSAYENREAQLPEMMGVVAAVADECVLVVGEPLSDEGWPEVLLHVLDAPVYDLMTGCLVGPEEITEGAWVRVAYGYPLTDTEPPLADASEIWLHYGEDGSAAFKAMVSENIQYDEESCTFMTADGKYRVTLTPETQIIDINRGYADPADIRPGLSMFVWVDMVTASSPAQAYPDKVVLIDFDYRGIE